MKETQEQKTKENFFTKIYSKIANFFKNISNMISNGFSWIKEQERKLMSEKKKPGPWVMVKPPQGRDSSLNQSFIGDQDFLRKYKKREDNKKVDKTLPKILEINPELEESILMSSNKLKEAKVDSKTLRDSKNIQENNHEYKKAL